MLEQICKAQDKINELRRAQAPYDDLKAAAIALLELRREAERKRFGRAKSQINAISIASLLR